MQLTLSPPISLELTPKEPFVVRYDFDHLDRAVWCGGAVWCGAVWCGVVWCGVVWCGVVWCGVVWCGVMWCGYGVWVWCDVMWGLKSSVWKTDHGFNVTVGTTTCIVALWTSEQFLY